MKVITGLFFIFLTGCASVSDKGSNNLETESYAKIEDLDVVEEQKTEISPEVLYLLMTAEIAGQRNQYGVALEGYLRAAKKVNDVRVSERAAKIGVFLKDTQKTNEAVNLWLKQDDKNLTARKIAVIGALRGTDKAAAVNHLNKVLQQDPASFESTLIELIKAMEKDGNSEFVFDVLEELSIQHQDQAVVFFVQSILAGQLKRTEIASQKVDRALEIQPEWNKALILRSQMTAQKGDFETAKNDLSKVLQKTPENNRVRKMLAQIYIKLDAYDDAIDLYEELLETKPDDGESQFAIALIYLQQGNNKGAKKYLKGLVNKPAWDAQASFYLGRIEFKDKQFETALVWFDKVTQGPYVYDASMASISVLLNLKDYEEAEKRLTDLSIKYPKDSINLALLKAEVFSEQKKYQQAYDVLTESLQIHEDHKDILYTRALISEKLGRLNDLEDDLKRILIKNPEDANVLNALGYTLVDKTDRLDEAEQYLLQAIKLKPEEAVIIDSIGWLRYKQGKTDEALEFLRKAFEKQPESEIAAHLAEILWTVGSKDEAMRIFDQAIAEDAENEYLLEFKKKFLDKQDK